MLLILTASLGSSPAYAVLNGFVTPASVAFKVESMGLLDTAGNTVTVSSTGGSVTFSATGRDFAQAQFSSITIPEGRYVGATVSYDTSREITLDGFKYQGLNGSSGSDGQYMCSTSNAYSFQNSATCSSVDPFTLTVSGGSNRTYFAKVACVTTSARQSMVCQSGDNFLDSSIPANRVLNLMMDLYNSLLIDPSSTAVNNALNNQGNLYPVATLGKPGAAVHLSTHSGSGNAPQGEVTLLFDANKTLLGTFTFVVGGSGSVPGFCAGTGYAPATSAPAGSFLNSWGLTFVGQYDSSTGAVAFVTNNGSNNTTGTGMMLLKDIRQVAGTSIVMDCLTDSSTGITSWDSAFSPYLGYTYTANPGNHSGSATINLVKMTDPNSIFGVTGCGSGNTAQCGSYP